mmetsp:Transcript_24604/g.53283  ORF Transcript_24604/g.53283 Transcript_24604/m.53283 type:complete len:123 (+) Transcript_24604:1089-1457(+)
MSQVCNRGRSAGDIHAAGRHCGRSRPYYFHRSRVVATATTTTTITFVADALERVVSRLSRHRQLQSYEAMRPIHEVSLTEPSSTSNPSWYLLLLFLTCVITFFIFISCDVKNNAIVLSYDVC